MRRLARLVLLIAVAFGVAACGDDGGGGELVGVMWVVTGSVDYALDGATLTITSPAGRGVVFVADG